MILPQVHLAGSRSGGSHCVLCAPLPQLAAASTDPTLPQALPRHGGAGSSCRLPLGRGRLYLKQPVLGVADCHLVCELHPFGCAWSQSGLGCPLSLSAWIVTIPASFPAVLHLAFTRRAVPAAWSGLSGNLTVLPLGRWSPKDLPALLQPTSASECFNGNLVTTSPSSRWEGLTNFSTAADVAIYCHQSERFTSTPNR